MERLQTETSHSPHIIAKCAHADCICTVGNGEKYCSDYCAAQDRGAHAAADDECQCGHIECQHSAESLTARGLPGFQPLG